MTQARGEGSVKNRSDTSLLRGPSGKPRWTVTGVGAGTDVDSDMVLKPETVDATEPTMSEWGESRRDQMTPQTIEMNERLHAYDLAQAAQEKIAQDEARSKSIREARETIASRPANYLTDQMKSVFHNHLDPIIEQYTKVGFDDPDVLLKFNNDAYGALSNAGYPHDFATKANNWARNAVTENIAAAQAVTEEPMFAEKFETLIKTHSSKSYVEDEYIVAQMRSTVRRALIRDGSSKETADRGAEWAVRETQERAAADHEAYLRSGDNMVMSEGYVPFEFLR